MDEYTTLYKAIRPRVSFSNTIIFGFNPKDYSRNEHDANYVFFSVNDPSVAKNIHSIIRMELLRLLFLQVRMI